MTREALLSKSCMVFSGGQIRIPKWVLDKLEIKDGDVLQLEITENGDLSIEQQKNFCIPKIHMKLLCGIG